MGGNSGAGSYNQIGVFKAEIVNSFVKANGVRTVVEFGFGDGQQLTRAEYVVFMRLRLRFEPLGSRGHSWSAGSALNQVFISLVPRIVSSVCHVVFMLLTMLSAVVKEISSV
jgi:hypothetical protein